MIDLILFAFVVGVFVSGFWLGNRYKSLREMGAAAIARVGKFFD